MAWVVNLVGTSPSSSRPLRLASGGAVAAAGAVAAPGRWSEVTGIAIGYCSSSSTCCRRLRSCSCCCTESAIAKCRCSSSCCCCSRAPVAVADALCCDGCVVDACDRTCCAAAGCWWAAAAGEGTALRKPGGSFTRSVAPLRAWAGHSTRRRRCPYMFTLMVTEKYVPGWIPAGTTTSNSRGPEMTLTGEKNIAIVEDPRCWV